MHGALTLVGHFQFVTMMERIDRETGLVFAIMFLANFQQSLVCEELRIKALRSSGFYFDGQLFISVETGKHFPETQGQRSATFHHQFIRKNSSGASNHDKLKDHTADQLIQAALLKVASFIHFTRFFVPFLDKF